MPPINQSSRQSDTRDHFTRLRETFEPERLRHPELNWPPASQADFEPNQFAATAAEESPYVEALKQSYHQVAMVAIRKHRDISQLENNSPALVWENYIQIMAGTPRLVLEVVAHGNLQLRKMDDAPLKEALDFFRRRNDNQPAIYMLELVDSLTKQAPTPNQILKMLEYATEYVERRDHYRAYRIDRFKHASATLAGSQRGERAYMKDSNHRDEFDKLKAAIIKRFRGLGPREMEHPERQPMRVVGYSKYGSNCLQARYAHDGAYFLTGLFDAICYAFANEIGGDFTIQDHGDIIHLIAIEEHLLDSEQLFTAVGQAYTSTGRGFCHAPAGDTASAGDGTNFDWPSITTDALVHSCYLRNMEEEMLRLSELRDRIDEVDRLRARLRELDRVAEEHERRQQADAAEREELERQRRQRQLDFIENLRNIARGLDLLKEAKDLLEEPY